MKIAEIEELLPGIGDSLPIYPKLIHLFGMNAGILLGLLLKKDKKWLGKGWDGLVCVSSEEFYTETGLTYDQQLRARRHLVTQGIIHEQRGGLPGRLWFRINQKNLRAKLQERIVAAVKLSACFNN